ncbi:MAG: HAMP domain-containing histidine kinase [Cryobacterium sp.]|nr:HAMP domain-containing histidine kinase [Oligoflexia bacterium]
MSECGLRQAVEDVLTELSMSAGDRFVLKGKGAVVGYWCCDELRRVNENLVLNAVKYGDSDSPITIDFQTRLDCILLSVHNRGFTLSLEEQENLFKPFSRTISAPASGQRGWGLGLTLVRGVCESHGGSVSVRSLPKKGTTFIVQLPRDSRWVAETPPGSAS